MSKPCMEIFAASAIALAVLSAASAQPVQLSVTIQPPEQAVRAGDEVPITFIVTNTGTEVYRHVDRTYDRSGRIGNYRLEAFDEDGRAVPDPRTRARARMGYVGGGLGRFAELPPGASYTKTIALNDWAYLTTPGIYTLRGIHVRDDGARLVSPPVVLRLLPRSDAAMDRHVTALAEALSRRGDDRARAALVRRLMFTRHRRAVRPILSAGDAGVGNVAFWIGEAFAHHLPREAHLRSEVVAWMRRNGLRSWSLAVLTELEVPTQTIAELVDVSLADPRERVHGAAALAAQQYPDDRYTARLIQIAVGAAREARLQAIFALALHRTEAGVAALRQLLQDADPQIRTNTRLAIQGAYRMPGRTSGRPLRPDDFPALAGR